MQHIAPTIIDAAAGWDMLDGPMPRGVLGLSDPNVHRIDGRWVMFVGGYSSSFRNRLYRATLPAGSALSQDGWRLDRDERGKLGTLVPDGRRGDWDAGGMHTPSYVPRQRDRPARIYYAGRRTRKRYGEGSSYAVGLLEQLPDGSWQRLAGPVLRGGGDRPSALEPTVILTEDGYRMWFLATPHEVGPGEQPDFELRVTDSADGCTWTQPRTFATSQEGYFDIALYRATGGWAMLLARGTNLHDTHPFPEQGLWWMNAPTPSPDRAAWSMPERVLDTDAPRTAAWMGRGVCGPSVAVDGDGSMLVFFTGTYRASQWWREAGRRVLTGQRPPVPAPYHLATGSAKVRHPGAVGDASGFGPDRARSGILARQPVAGRSRWGGAWVKPDRPAGQDGCVPVVVRPANASDAQFLAEMLVLAAFWREDGPSGTVAQVLSQPNLARYVAGWPRRGDLGVIAMDGREPVGAAWLRLLPATDPGYGFVDAATPELSIGVVPMWRGRRVGTCLLDALIVAASEHGLLAVSLSVEQDNHARRLYERAGFERVDELNGALTMLLRFPR